MLRTFRTKIKFWSNVALWPVIIAFIAFYGWSFSGSQQKSKGPVAAIIGDTEISQNDVLEMEQRFQQHYRQLYQDNFARMSANMNFRQMALDKMIDDIVLLQTADQMGVMVSEDEIMKSIEKTPYFQVDGKFSNGLFQRVLRQMGVSSTQYKQFLQHDLTLEKVRTLIGSIAPVTNDELKEMYERQNVKINCDFYQFRARSYLEEITVDEAEMKAYYDAHQEEFKLDDQYKIQYIHFDPSKMKDEVELFDEDIDDFYTKHLDQYEEKEQVSASHILFKVPSDAPEEKWDEALNKAKSALKRLEAGESFESLAKELSDDPSGANGGDLGYFSKGRMVKPFEEAAWNLEIDEVSEPVKSQFGYHIIKKTGYKKASFKRLEEVEDSIVNTLKLEGAKELAMDKAQKIFQTVTENTTLEDIAKNENLEIKTSDLFTLKAPPAELGRSKNLDMLLKEATIGKIIIPIESSNGVFLISIEEIVPSHIPPFEETKESVETKTKNKKALDFAKEKAQTLYDSLIAGSPWSDAGKPFEIESQSTGEFANTGFIPRFGSDPDLADTLFSKNVGDVSGVYELRDSAVIFKLISKKEFNEEDFQEKLPDLRKQTFASKQYQAVTSYVKQRRDQLMANGELQILMATESEETF
ncbi:SurA N-terminal domain-containing protein [bacterium]|nr:SurA N-terminal domain-containing protein [candidate division CSSED10-310 bacterium]